MTDWSTLRDAYGPAGDMPRLLADLTPSLNAHDYFGRLCHQGGPVYSASFAALPALAAAAGRWRPEERLMVLLLAGSILACGEVIGPRDQYMRGMTPTVRRLQELAAESLAAPGWSRSDFVYLLQAIRGIEEDRVWGVWTESLNDEAQGDCPGCGEHLAVAVGTPPGFTAAEERNSATGRTPVVAAAGELPAVGRWMEDEARRAGQIEVADAVRRLFGSTTCPTCGKAFDVPDILPPGR